MKREEFKEGTKLKIVNGQVASPHTVFMLVLNTPNKFTVGAFLTLETEKDYYHIEFENSGVILWMMTRDGICLYSKLIPYSAFELVSEPQTVSDNAQPTRA